jgi:uncharacterized phage protein (TIGR01671 family)
MEQRPLKFRVWDSLTNKMHKVAMLALDAKGNIKMIGAGNNVGQLTRPFFVVMQFTGLRDEDGKEIYEGDILHYYFVDKANPENDEAGHMIVEWDDSNSAFVYYCPEIGMIMHVWDDDEMWRLRVVGNIYANRTLADELLNA